jgi:hypothetical protein
MKELTRKMMQNMVTMNVLQPDWTMLYEAHLRKRGAL